MKIYNVVTENSQSGANATPYRTAKEAFKDATAYAFLRGCAIYADHGIDNCIYYATNKNGSEAVWITEHII